MGRRVKVTSDLLSLLRQAQDFQLYPFTLSLIFPLNSPYDLDAKGSLPALKIDFLSNSVSVDYPENPAGYN